LVVIFIDDSELEWYYGISLSFNI